MPHHLTPCSLVRGTKPHFLKQTRERNSSRFKNCRLSSTKSESACAYFSRPSSGSVRHVYAVEKLKRELAINHRIIEDRAGEPLVFNRASQNIITTAMLLRNMPKPSTPEAHRARDEIRGLLETAAMQQAESSASRRRGLASK
jgi:hypothetical protein